MHGAITVQKYFNIYILHMTRPTVSSCLGLVSHLRPHFTPPPHPTTKGSQTPHLPSTHEYLMDATRTSSSTSCRRSGTCGGGGNGGGSSSIPRVSIGLCLLASARVLLLATVTAAVLLAYHVHNEGPLGAGGGGGIVDNDARQQQQRVFNARTGPSYARRRQPLASPATGGGRLSPQHHQQQQRDVPSRVIHSRNCTQAKTCAYFSDILVVIHLNPQRFEWLELVLDFALLFVPNVMVTTIPDVAVTRNLTFAEKRAYLDHLVLGPKNRYVHVIENGFGLTGDHHDVVKAMQLYPDYKGYFYWAHEDGLPGFWNMVRYDKETVWHQPVEPAFSFSHQLPLCPLKHRKHMKFGTRVKQGSRHCVVAMLPHEARDWNALRPALARIRNDSEADYKRVIPGVTFAAPMYYAPRTTMSRFVRYSAYLYDVRGVNEWADHVVLRAAANEGKGSSLMKAVNTWPDQGRFQSVQEFSWSNDVTHPVRPCAELYLRVSNVARRVQIHSMLPTLLADEKLEKARLPAPSGPLVPGGLWSTCYTCDAYPLAGGFTRQRKGRFHTCSEGCADEGGAVNMTTYNGVVQVRREDATPPEELEFEGFWSARSQSLFFARYAALNRSSLFTHLLT